MVAETRGTCEPDVENCRKGARGGEEREGTGEGYVRAEGKGER